MFGLALGLAFAGSLEDALEAREAGELEVALQTLEGLADSDPSAGVWSEVAVTRSWMGDLRGAQSAYATALELEPQRLSAKVGHARITGWRGQRRKAERALSELAEQSEEARGSLVRVQLARHRRKAARTTLNDLQSGPLREELTDQWNSQRPTRLTLSGAYVVGSAGRAELDVAHTRSGTLTLRSGLRMGRSLAEPLSTTAWAARAGVTWSDHGVWLTPSVRWEEGIWTGMDAAVSVGPCVPGAGVDTRLQDAQTRLQGGIRCMAGPVAVSGRGYLSLGENPAHAWVGSVGTQGRWRATLEGVLLGDNLGGRLTSQWAYESPAWGVRLDVGAGTGALKGPLVGLALTVSR